MAHNLHPEELAGASTSTVAVAVAERPQKVKVAHATAAAATLALLLSSALALSLHRAYDFAVRVDRLHVEAPQDADFATLSFDVDLEQPPRWSPHTVKFHGAECGFRARGAEVVAEVPEIHYVGAKRARFQAKIRAAPSGLLLAPTPQCAITSTVDLFGTGFVVPRTVYKPLADAPLAPRVWFQREGPVSRTGPTFRNSSMMLDQTVLARAHLPADGLPEFLRGLLGSAEISVNTSFAYAEANDGSVHLTKTIDAGLDVKSDGSGGYEISLPVNVSCHIKPSLALTVAKMLVGISRPLEGAPPAEHSSVDRAVRFAAEQPQSPVAQLLGPSRVFGWRSHEASVVNDLARGARRRLSRRLARRLMSTAGEDIALPPVHKDRRLMADTRLTLHETIYADGDVMEIQASALLGDERMTLSFEMSGGVKADLVASDSGIDATLRFSLNIDSKEVAYIDLASSDSAGASLSAVYKDRETDETLVDVGASENAGGDFSTMYVLVNDDNGNRVVDVKASLDENGDDSASAKIYNSELDWEFATFTYSDTGSARNIAVTVRDSETKNGQKQFEMTVDGTRDGDKTDTSFEAKVYGEAGVVEQQVQGSILDNYGVDDGFALDVTVSEDGETTMTVDGLGTHKDEELNVQATARDGQGQQMFKLSPLTIKYTETEYSAEATVHDSEDALLGSGKLSLAGGTAGGELKVDLGYPLRSTVTISGMLSVANPAEELLGAPCLQGECEFSAAVHDAGLTLDFESKPKDGSDNYYLADVDVKMVDAEWEADVSQVFIEGGLDFTGLVSLKSNNAGELIEMDDFVIASSGSLKDPNNKTEILTWSFDSSVNFQASSAGVALTVQTDNEGQLEQMIDLDVDLVETSSGGTVTGTGSMSLSLSGEEFFTAIGQLKDESNKRTATAEVRMDGDEVLGMSAEVTEDDSAGTVMVVGSMDLEGEPMGSVHIDTLDTDLKASIQLVVNNNASQQFLSFGAGIEFGATGSPLNDWRAGCEAEAKDPENTSAIVMSMSMTAECAGGSFITSALMGFNGEAPAEMMSMTGTSAATEVIGSGTVGGAGGPSIELAFAKQDGSLNALSEMTSSVIVVGDDFSAEAGVAYDGEDAWGISAKIEDDGRVLDAQANASGKWISAHWWADDGAMYQYFNTSTEMVDVDSKHSEMWEINYLLTHEFEESTNITTIVLRDSDQVSETSVRSFMRMQNDGKWEDVFVYSFNSSTVSVKVVSGNFKVEVPVSKAQAFVADPKVKRAFAVVITEKAGVGEEKVNVWLSAVTGGSRRLQAGAQIQVDYTITLAEKGSGVGEGSASDGPSAAEVAGALQSVTAETFVTEFEEELQELAGNSATEFIGFSKAVAGSASAPSVEDVSSGINTTQDQQDPDKQEPGQQEPESINSAIGSGGLAASFMGLGLFLVQI